MNTEEIKPEKETEFIPLKEGQEVLVIFKQNYPPIKCRVVNILKRNRLVIKPL